MLSTARQTGIFEELNMFPMVIRWRKSIGSRRLIMTERK